MGLITPGGEGAARADAVRASLECMRHRGPDESGVWHDDDVALGFNRLSIIDVENSHQPLTYASDRYRIVFNGEIYNYLELREELARDHGAPVRHRRGHRGHRRRLRRLGSRRGPPPARHVRVPDLGHPRARAVRRPRPVRHQAPLRLRRAARRGVRQREEEPARAGEEPRRADHRARPDRAAALPAAAVRAGAALAAPLDPPRRVGDELHRLPRRADVDGALLRPDVRREAGRRRGPRARRDHRGPARLGGQAHARRRHRGRVPLRGHRLDGHRRARQGAQPGPHHLHHGLRARGLLRGRRRPRVGRGDRRAPRRPHRHRPGDDGRAAAHRLVPRRPGGRPRAGAPVVRGARGPQARQGRALRRGRRRAVRRLHDLQGAALARAVREAARGGAQARRVAVGEAARRDARQGPPAPRRAPPRGALLRQRPHLPQRPARRGPARARPRALARRHHRAALRRLGLLGPGGADAARRPLHVAARRHPRQGRQDDDGQLPRAARAVPRQGGLRGRVAPADRPEGRPRHHEVRAAPGDRRHRAAARPEPPQARLPGADPPLARPRHARVGPGDRPRLPDRRDPRQGRGAAPHRRPPRRPRRPLAADLDDPGVHALARHLRRGAHPPRDPGAELPRLCRERAAT